MGVVLDLTLGGLGSLLGGLAQAPARMDHRPAMRITAVLLSAATKENFAGQHDPEGKPWAALLNPPRRRRGGQILRDKGLLMASYAAGGHHVETVDRAGLVWGSNLDRAGWHQRGTSRMVARPQVGFTPKLAAKVQAVVAEQTLKQLQALR